MQPLQLCPRVGVVVPAVDLVVASWREASAGSAWWRWAGGMELARGTGVAVDAATEAAARVEAAATTRVAG